MAQPIQTNYARINIELHEKFKAGEPGALHDMITFNRAWAYAIANRYSRAAALEYRPSIDIKDLEQMALWGLWEAIEEWDPEKGALSTLIKWKVGNKIRDVFRTKLSVSLDAPISADDPKGDKKVDRLPDLDAKDPELEQYSNERCREYFEFMQDKAVPSELDRLRRYVYGLDSCPHQQEIKSCLIRGSKSMKIRAFRKTWLDNSIRYYPSPGNYGSGGHSSEISDPTADTAIKIIELEERLSERLRAKLTRRERRTLSHEASETTEEASS